MPQLTGVDARGFVVREGDLARVQPELAAVVAGFEAAARGTFGANDLHSLYLYGSIPRGTARLGHSDLDGQILLTREPTEDDRALVRRIEADLGRAHPEVSHVGILLDSVDALTDPADRHDGGFHLRVLCTPLWGPDAGELVDPHRVDLDLVRGVQTGWRAAIMRLRDHAHEGPRANDEVKDLCRATGRRLARVAFSWVAPRWGGWTSDPDVMHRVVTALEPTWSSPMASATGLGWRGVADLDLARTLLGGWALDLEGRGSELGV